MQLCKKCNTSKQYDAFYFNKARNKYGSTCKACVKIEKAAFYQANKERLDAKTAAYRKANPESIAATKAKSRLKNVEHYRAKNLKWQRENAERHLEHSKAFYHRNAAREKARTLAHARANPDKVAAKNNKRRVARLNQHDPTTDKTIVDSIYAKCPEGYEVDHFYPINLGGSDHQENLCYLPTADNRSKSGKHPAQCEQQLKSLIWPKLD